MQFRKKAHDDKSEKGQPKAFVAIITTTLSKQPNGFLLKTEAIAKKTRKKRIKNGNKKSKQGKRPEKIVLAQLLGAILSKPQGVKKRKNKMFLKSSAITIIRRATLPKIVPNQKNSDSLSVFHADDC